MLKEYFFREGCFITEIHNTPDDPGLSIAKARVEPGKKTKWHALTKTTERYMIIEGSGMAEKGNESPVELNVGDSFLIPPETKQRIMNTGSVDLVFLALCTPRFQQENYYEVDPTS